MAEPAQTAFCPVCGYDLAADELVVCPECGTPISEETRRFEVARAELLARARAHRWRQIACTGAGLVVCILGVVLLTPGRGEPVAAAVLLVGLALAHEAVGALVPLVLDPPLRPLVRALWAAGAPWLHAPWLSVPGIIVGYTVLVGVTTSLGLGRSTAIGLCFVFLAGWVVGGVAASSRWWRGWDEGYRKVGLPPVRGPVRAALVIHILAWVVGFLGLMGGMVAVWGRAYEAFEA